MKFSAILPLLAFRAVFAAPEVKIGHTTLLGRDVTGLKQEFFGGEQQHLGHCRD
jgi:acetylcholinesterase